MMMTTDQTETVDEQATLSSLESMIQKRRQAAELRDTVNQQYRQVSVCETEERRTTQLVDQLEGRVKTHHKQLLLGTVKPGELSSLKERLAEAKERLATALQQLDTQREAFCLSEEVSTQLKADLSRTETQLRGDLSTLYKQRFSVRDAGLYGKRGEVSWMDPDPYSPERWQRQWRDRAFHFLLHKGFASDLSCIAPLSALVMLFRQQPFEVRVVVGFVPTSTRSKDPLGVGEVVAVPKQLSEAEAFEELVRRRVEFVETAGA